MRKVFIYLFFLIQAVGIVYARFTDVRYFCWAPYDQLTRYSILMKINGEQLPLNTPSERYRIANPGKENRSIHNVFSIIETFESRNSSSDSIEVQVYYSVNGKEIEVWDYSGD